MQDDDSLVATSPQGSSLVSDDTGVVGKAFAVGRLDPRDSYQHQQQHQYGSSQNHGSSSGNWGAGKFGMPSLFSPFSGFNKTSQQSTVEEGKDEVIDFTYVNIHEADADEVDILLAGGDPGTGQVEPPQPLDSLAVLLSGSTHDEAEQLVSLSEKATEEMIRAVDLKRKGHMQEALDAHSTAARLFHETAVVLRDRNASMAKSFLLLSQTEARSALGLKRIMKVRPNILNQDRKDASSSSSQQPKDRIRETVRGAWNHKQPQADLSESVFLGSAKGGPVAQGKSQSNSSQEPTSAAKQTNPIDEMLKLERELRDMDMALEMGNSIASLDAKSRMKNMDGSFMVVPPGSNALSSSYMSSSMILSQPPVATANPSRVAVAPVSSGAAGARARANRVSTVSAPRSVPAPAPRSGNTGNQQPANFPSNSLESSWWGNSGASQVLTNSVVSLASTAPASNHDTSNQTTNNKQLMRLMDSLKRLGDENAALLREVEQAEAARAEARAARQEMRRFKQEYTKRFDTVKSMLEKIRKKYEQEGGAPNNPVLNSEILINASASEQLARQEQLIRKLTADLKKEKEDAKKKEIDLKRYENFYREVKAKSQQKAAQRRQAEARNAAAS